ncbi:MAG: hypothetical protein LBR22_08860 [Desulfovibrio sp.]|jgi:hypothetical protein|nr:hypothetical protein [Desulfovibrio sp.]
MATSTELKLKRAIAKLSPYIDPESIMMLLALYDTPKDRYKAIKPLLDDLEYLQEQQKNPENSGGDLSSIFWRF